MNKNGRSFKPMIKRWRSTRLIYRLLFLLIILVVTLLIYQEITAQPKETPHTSTVVSVAAAKTKDVPVYISALGSVSPPLSVLVKTQVNGQLLRFNFKEGQAVKAGDLLAEIDSKPYEALLLQAQGQLEKDEAFLANARLDLKRYRTLWAQNSISKQTLDTQVWLVKQYEGALKSDQGVVDNAQVNLAYCRIKSPLHGRVGLTVVDPGNIVQTTDTAGLVVINTMNPIEVEFSIPEDSIPQVLTQIRSAKTLTVEAYDRMQGKLLKTGKLLTIDNQIDSSTGTVKLKAEFSNDDETLFPNQFVNIKLMVAKLNKATLILTRAIQHGTRGPYVYVLKDDKTVGMRAVKTSVTQGNETVIISGVSSGQLVVIEGSDKLTDGALVKAAPQRPPAVSPSRQQ